MQPLNPLTSRPHLKKVLKQTIARGRIKALYLQRPIFYCGCRNRGAPQQNLSIFVITMVFYAIEKAAIQKNYSIFYCAFSIAAAAAAGQIACRSMPKQGPKQSFLRRNRSVFIRPAIAQLDKNFLNYFFSGPTS